MADGFGVRPGDPVLEANVVRVPLNETCWLASTASTRHAGDNYRRAIAATSRCSTALGYWSSWICIGPRPGRRRRSPGADANRDHTPDFWRQVAAAYEGNNRVVFDRFNEPYPDNNSDTPEAGAAGGMGTCRGMSFQRRGCRSWSTRSAHRAPT